MKIKMLLAAVLLAGAAMPSQGQRVLQAGDSYLFTFADLPYIQDSSSLEMPDGSFSLQLQVLSATGMVEWETFEDVAAENLLTTGYSVWLDGTNPQVGEAFYYHYQFQPNLDGAWGDNNGALRVKVTSGSLRLDSADFRYYRQVVNPPFVTWKMYQTVVPAAGAELKFNMPTVSDGNVTISWTGNGTLEEAVNASGPYSTASNQANPQTLPASGMKFFRLRQ